MKFINPTGTGIRSDAGGDGHHGAPRGARLHDGLDLKVEVGQKILAPHDGYIRRRSYPYGDDVRWHGLVLEHKRITTTIWYMEPLENIIRREVKAGDLIGYAQDISKKEGYDKVTPHIHLRIENIDPLFVIPMPE
jgi:murein DD-endopeptidase MepM/ murein hydrolase activator NlpD